jgi:hypothetical protein
MEVIEGAPPAEYGDKTSVVIVVTTRSGLGIKPAARRYHGFLRHLSAPPTAASIWHTAAIMGQLHLRQRSEYRPLSGRAGVRRHARSRQ